MYVGFSQQPNNLTSIRPTLSGVWVALLISVLFSFPRICYSQQTLTLTDGQGEYVLGRFLDILPDPEGVLNLSDVTSAEYAKKFKRSEVDVPKVILSQDRY